jgi:hypothetical protein
MSFRFTFFILFISCLSYAQVDTVPNYSDVVFLPPGLNFLPLRANYQEAKLGILYYPNTTNLKVDIGNSIDLLRFNLKENQYITVGIEFMAYAYSMSFSQLRLQIGAVDGFFGGNATFTNESPGNRFSARFRYIHNSAHLVDGFYDRDEKKWMNNKEPIPFTRDFAEIIFSDEISRYGLGFRPYIGTSYAVRIRPSILRKSTFCSGLEIHTGSDDEISKIHHHFFFAYHFQLAGLPVYQGSSQFQAGIKLGDWQKKGVNFFISYFNGNNMFNEFFDQRIERFGVGFSVDFP